jgi:hypothetical protein
MSSACTISKVCLDSWTLKTIYQVAALMEGVVYPIDPAAYESTQVLATSLAHTPLWR